MTSGNLHIRAHHNTETALEFVMNDLLASMHENRTSLVVLLDQLLIINTS